MGYICNRSNKEFLFRFSGNAWIRLNFGGGGRWEVWSFVNLTRRYDNGLINRSPVTTTSPIIRVQSGCFHEINILGKIFSL